jgi:hypothetical protein
MRLDFSHDSFFGWTNLLKRSRKIGAWRTPYPVILGNPTTRQVLWNWNRADSGLFWSTLLLSLAMTRGSIRRIHNESVRQYVFNNLMVVSLLSAGVCGAVNSWLRLRGETNNGLRWERVVDETRDKYNIAGPMEQATIWGIFAPAD